MILNANSNETTAIKHLLKLTEYCRFRFTYLINLASKMKRRLYEED